LPVLNVTEGMPTLRALDPTEDMPMLTALDPMERTAFLTAPDSSRPTDGMAFLTTPDPTAGPVEVGRLSVPEAEDDLNLCPNHHVGAATSRTNP
jgi:hypothetical protein